MITKHIDKDRYRLHFIKNKNFKTVFIKFIVWNKLKKEEITKRHLLINNLLFSSSNYKTPRELTIKKTDLYGLNIISNLTRKSNYIFTEISMSVIMDKYAEEGLLKESIMFLFDLLQKPNIKDKGFDLENFNITKQMLKSDLERELEDPNSFAFKNYMKLLSKQVPYNISLLGDLKQLDKINNKNLYDYYRTFFKNNNIDIIITGDFSFEEMEKLFDDKFLLKGSKDKIEDLYLSYKKDVTTNIIKTDFNQSKLIMGGSTEKFTLKEKKYVSLIYNIIFGNSPKSKLFQNVREKKSLAYSIASNFNRLDGIFVIYAGISKNNYEETKNEIFAQVKEMKKGNFSTEDINNAKTYIKTIIKESDDFQNAIVDRYFNNLYLDIDSKDIQLSEINKITKEDIIKLAKKIEIDTVLLIEENYERD